MFTHIQLPCSPTEPHKEIEKKKITEEIRDYSGLLALFAIVSIISQGELNDRIGGFSNFL